MITEDRSRIGAVPQGVYFSVESVYGLIPLETRLHMQRVAGYCDILARIVEREPAFVNSIAREFYPYAKYIFKYHDIGYAFISQDELSDKEKVRQHVILADRAYDNIVYKRLSPELEIYARECSKFHHENYDGSGYPHGLKGDEIPLVARICAIADLYDRLVMEKPYDIYKRNDEIMKIIESESGRKFQPRLVELFLNCEEKLKSSNIRYGMYKVD